MKFFLYIWLISPILYIFFNLNHSNLCSIIIYMSYKQCSLYFKKLRRYYLLQRNNPFFHLCARKTNDSSFSQFSSRSGSFFIRLFSLGLVYNESFPRRSLARTFSFLNYRGCGSRVDVHAKILRLIVGARITKKIPGFA